MGFVCTLSDPGIYVHFHGQNIIILVIYIDDSLFIGSNKSYLTFKKRQFMDRWESRDLGEATEYLGMRITQDCAKCTLKLDQISYATKVIECFKLNNAKVTCTPLSLGYNPAPNPKTTTPQLHSHYQSVIGSLLYIMLGTHSDIAFSVIKMSQFSSNPSEEHLQKALYIV